jgi:nitrite reductase (NADH) small subunit
MSKPVYVCRLDDLAPNTGACALVEGRQVALFRIATPEGESLYALANHDPFSKANVLSRGLVGSAGERLFVASPVYKQRFDLATGQCLDNPEVQLQTWQVQCLDGDIYVQAQSGQIAA